MGNLGEYLFAEIARAHGKAEIIYLLMSHDNITFDEAVLKFGLPPDEAETYRPYVEELSSQNSGGTSNNPQLDEPGTPGEIVEANDEKWRVENERSS